MSRLATCNHANTVLRLPAVRLAPGSSSSAGPEGRVPHVPGRAARPGPGHRPRTPDDPPPRRRTAARGRETRARGERDGGEGEGERETEGDREPHIIRSRVRPAAPPPPPRPADRARAAGQTMPQGHSDIESSIAAGAGGRQESEQGRLQGCTGWGKP